jgi:hypothetical protein
MAAMCSYMNRHSTKKVATIYEINNKYMLVLWESCAQFFEVKTFWAPYATMVMMLGISSFSTL